MSPNDVGMVLEVRPTDVSVSPLLRLFVASPTVIHVDEANLIFSPPRGVQFIHTHPSDAELSIAYDPQGGKSGSIEVGIENGEPREMYSGHEWPVGTYEQQAKVAFELTCRYSPPVVLAVRPGRRREVEGPASDKAWARVTSELGSLAERDLETLVPQLRAEQVLRLATSTSLPETLLDRLAATCWAPLMARVALNPQASEGTLARLSYSHPVLVAQNPALELMSLSGSLKGFSPPVLESVERRGWPTL